MLHTVMRSSMFSARMASPRNSITCPASKVALASLVENLKRWEFQFIDAQMTTEHMLRLGAKELPRRVFLKRLQSALRHPTKRGRWRIEA
jgi:leucyl/phenylalanyl-tRNA--protein transferase